MVLCKMKHTIVLHFQLKRTTIRDVSSDVDDYIIMILACLGIPYFSLDPFSWWIESAKLLSLYAYMVETLDINRKIDCRSFC